MIDWLIRPGAGSLRSGMSRAAVGALIGQPQSETRHAPDDVRD